MSGIEVIGLVSAIVGIVEAIGKVSKNLRDANDIPRAFNEVAERLPLVRETLQSVENHISHAAEDGVYDAMKKVLENCREKAEQLQEIFRAVAPSKRISRIKRYSMAVRRLGKGSLVEILAKGMMEDAQALVLAHSAQAATESQVMELSEAIRELSTIEASLPEESAASQMHYGHGDNIAGSKFAGNHNEFSGSGTAYFAPVTQHAYLDKETEPSLSQLCLRSLAFDEMDSRPIQIKPAAPGTCEWILQNKTYQTWKNRDRSLLWIKGKPGSGKSTLLRYASETTRTTTKGEKPLVLSFFFNGRGTDVQKTADGLFRSLLCQMQSKTPEALEDLEAKFKQRISTLGKYGENWIWEPSELHYYTDIALRKALEFLPIVLFIDALDECGELNAQNLAEQLSSLLHRTSSERLKHLHICVTCRHYPVLNIDDGLEICMDTENAGDISIFVQTKLHSFQKRTGSKIAEYISKHAEGVFLWASLAVNKTLTLERERMGIERIETEVRLIPQTLHTLYSELFRQLHPDSFDLIELICFAGRYLTMLELHWMLTLAQNPALGSLRECVNDRRFRLNSAAMEWDVKTLGRGLIEYNRKQGVVQFIHQSVKDFFVEWALPSLRSMTPEQTAKLAHSRIAEISLRYLNMLRVERMDISKDFSRFPFMYYAAASWTLHLSKTSHEIQQSFPRPPDATIDWWWLHCPHPREDIFCVFFPKRMTLLQLALLNGWTGVLKGIQVSKNMLDLNVLPKGVEGRTPLHIAATFGYPAMSAFLLQHGASPDEVDMYMRTPLHTAAQYGHAGVLELLLESGVRLDPQDIFGSTPLSIAIQNGDTAVIELLLKKGANVNSTYRVGFRLTATIRERALIEVLQKADWFLMLGEAILGTEVCLALLLSLTLLHYDELLRPRGIKRTPLAQAVELGNAKVVQLLLKYNAEPMKGKVPFRAIGMEIVTACGLWLVCVYLPAENLSCIISKETQEALCIAMGLVAGIAADMDD